MNLKVSIKNNILKYNGKTIVMKKRIIDYIIMSEYIIILEENTRDGDYDLLYCFDKYLEMMWKIKTPDSEFIGNEQRPYVGVTITQSLSKTQGLTVVDTLGRFLIVDINTGEVVDMFCNRF